MAKKYTCAGMNCGGRVKGYASGGGVGGGGGAGGGGWGDEGVYTPKYDAPPSERGMPMKASPLGGRIGDRVPKYTDEEITASKRR